WARLSVWSAYAATIAYGEGTHAPVPPEFFTLPAQQQQDVDAAAAELPTAADGAALRPLHPWAISGLRSVDALDSHEPQRAADELEAARTWFHQAPRPLRAELAKLAWPTHAGIALPSARLARDGRLPGEADTRSAAGQDWDDTVAGLLNELE